MILIPPLSDLLKTEPPSSEPPDIDAMMKAIASGSPVATDPAQNSFAWHPGRDAIDDLLRFRAAPTRVPSTEADLAEAFGR